MRTIADRIETLPFTRLSMKPREPNPSLDALRLAARMADIEPFHVMEIQRRAL